MYIYILVYVYIYIHTRYLCRSVGVYIHTDRIGSLVVERVYRIWSLQRLVIPPYNTTECHTEVSAESAMPNPMRQASSSVRLRASWSSASREAGRSCVGSMAQESGLQRTCFAILLHVKVAVVQAPSVQSCWPCKLTGLGVVLRVI